jgi:hypothetical protein
MAISKSQNFQHGSRQHIAFGKKFNGKAFSLKCNTKRLVETWWLNNSLNQWYALTILLRVRSGQRTMPFTVKQVNPVQITDDHGLQHNLLKLKSHPVNT